MKTLDVDTRSPMEVVPGKMVGPFFLGMGLGDAFALIKAIYRYQEDIEFFYSKENPLEVDNVIRIPHKGILLHFSSISQLLIRIELTDYTKVRLRYNNTIFNNCKNILPSFVSLYKLFGPSFPGDYTSSINTYSLCYPGLTFFFPIPHQYDEMYRKNKKKLPIELPDGTTPIIKRLAVFLKKNQNPECGSIESSHCSNGHSIDVRRGEVEEKFKVVVGYGLVIKESNESIEFGDNCQDALSKFGTPTKIHFKSENKMQIHNSSEDTIGNKCQDYFYNYANHGIDLLFDAVTHRIKKIVLHCNFPGHSEFLQYTLCLYAFDGGCSGCDECSKGCIRRGTHWTDIQKHNCLGNLLQSKPIILDNTKYSSEGYINSNTKERDPKRNGGGNVDQLSNRNPFGSTSFYAYNDVIFEVMENDHVAKVILLPIKM